MIKQTNGEKKGENAWMLTEAWGSWGNVLNTQQTAAFRRREREGTRRTVVMER